MSTDDKASPVEGTVGRCPACGSLGEMKRKTVKKGQKRSYQRAIQSFISMKYNICCTAPQTISVLKNGNVKYEYQFTPEQKRMLDALDEAIDHFHKLMDYQPNAAVERRSDNGGKEI